MGSAWDRVSGIEAGRNWQLMSVVCVPLCSISLP